MNKTTQNRKIIPHQCVFLCLAMSICCGIVGCKCRKDSKTYHPGKPASSIPHAINKTKSYAVKELKGANGERSFFNYSNGKMTEGYGTAYGHFIISEYPLRIMVSSANDTLPGCSSNETRLSRFLVGGVINSARAVMPLLFSMRMPKLSRLAGGRAPKGRRGSYAHGNNTGRICG